MHTPPSIPFKNASINIIMTKMTLFLKLLLLLFFTIIPFLSLPIVNALPQQEQEQLSSSSSSTSSLTSSLPAFSSNNNNNDNDNYIIVLKPNLSKINITNHIQRIQKFRTSSSPLSSNLTSSLASTSPIAPSSIGNFQFYSSQLDDESLLNDDEAVHYYVKDVPMSLQELVQSDPPSWVISMSFSFHLPHGININHPMFCFVFFSYWKIYII